MRFKCVLISAFIFVSINAYGQCKAISGTPEKLDCAKTTPLVEGGKGKEWGKWHSVQSDPVLAGYRLQSVSFYLQGPHPCVANVSYDEGKAKASFSELAEEIIKIQKINVAITPKKGVGSWAECEDELILDGVKWRFRFQGWWTERRYIDDKGVHWDEIPETIKQQAMLHTVWVRQ